MGKNSGASARSTSSWVNFLSLVAICIIIVIQILKLIYHFVPSFDFIGRINGALNIIQNALCFIVVLVGGLNYAFSIQNTSTRILMIITCIVFAVLVILGFIYV